MNDLDPINKRGDKCLHDKALEIVYNEIKDKRFGILFGSLELLLEDNEKQHRKDLYTILKIKPDASLEDDQNTIDEWLAFTLEATANVERRITKRLVKFRRRISNKVGSKNESENLIHQQEDKMEIDNAIKWIVAGALILVGSYVCLQFLEKRQTQKSGSSASYQNPVSSPQPNQVVPVYLCLVVPSHVVPSHIVSGAREINLGQTGQGIKREEVERLIDNASYFLCTEHGVNSYEQSLSFLPGAEIPSDNQREVYVRIEISDGKEMLGKSIPYALKSNLKPEATFTVRKISLLRDLSGLDQFNRI